MLVSAHAFQTSEIIKGKKHADQRFTPELTPGRSIGYMPEHIPLHNPLDDVVASQLFLRLYVISLSIWMVNMEVIS